jgi:S-DNA-T family DNA segregation ATPase FtsK/SpoIIIE
VADDMLRCEQCGYDYASLDRAELPGALWSGAAAVAERLGALDDEAVRRRPEPEVWSPLEYACHVRLVMQVQRARVALALREDQPYFTPMGRDARAVEDRYNEQDPAEVAAGLHDDADELARAFEALDEREWGRTGIYTFPVEEVRSLDWVARHTVHELVHHRGDMMQR